MEHENSELDALQSIVRMRTALKNAIGKKDFSDKTRVIKNKSQNPTKVVNYFTNISTGLACILASISFMALGVFGYIGAINVSQTELILYASISATFLFISIYVLKKLMS